MFSFKNQVDDFYLKHLDNEMITVDVFAMPVSESQFKPQGVIRLGQAKLPLRKVLEGDSSFQA